MMSAQLKYSYSCLVLYNSPWTWTSSLRAMSCWKACQRSRMYLRHDSEGLPPCVQRDGAPGDAVNGNFTISGGETQQSGEQSALPWTRSTQQTHLCMRTHIYKHTQSIKKAWFHHFLQILRLASLCACMHQSLPAETILYILPGHILKALGPFFCGLAATISPFIRRPWTS